MAPRGPTTHAFPTRRSALRAGSVGLLGLGLAEVSALRAASSQARPPSGKSVIFIFLTGGLSHQDSFDMKPEAPDSVRGEFHPIATQTPGMRICEHLPLLAQWSRHYALVRSASTGSSEHELACHMLLTGRLDLPIGFNLNKVPNAAEWPSMAALATCLLTGRRNNLPPAAVLPQPGVNDTPAFRPGQFAGRLGPRHEAWHLHLGGQCPLGFGACPLCFRDGDKPFQHVGATIFETPALTLPEGGGPRLADRLGLLEHISRQQLRLEESEALARVDRHRRQAITVLADPKVRAAFDVEQADARTLERYGKNKFGLSLLMAYRLVQAGVSLVQVNLGKCSSWDLHNGNFLHLKRDLLPYLDRGVAALLDDLRGAGLLDTTLVVVTGEFGRTPKINANAGRDHWGPAMTMLLAGGGVRGGQIVGTTDKIAAYPTSDRQTPENLAATIYQTLGIPRGTMWQDMDGRPYELYCADPIAGLM